MADIIKDDTNDQMIVCPLVDLDYNLVTSSITNPTITLIINNGSEVNLSSTATLTYSTNMGGHKLIIPHTAISEIGRYCLNIQATGIQNYNLDGLIILPQSTFPTTSEISTAILAATTRTGRSISETLRILEIILTGSVTGLTNGKGSPIVFTLAESYVSFTVDSNGNRTLSTIHLV